MTTNNKIWHSAYQNKRTAARRYDLYLSRYKQGLDLTTGYKPEELLRLAELQTKLREVQFMTVTADIDPEAIADAAIELLEELESERAKEDKMPEYNRAFQKLAVNAIETLAEIVKRYTNPQTELIAD